MGCWNGTCALTNLPITAGDRVVAYVLRLNASRSEDGGGGIIEVDAYASAFGLPLRGKYNDYGGVKELDLDGNHQWWQARLAELSTQLMTLEAEPLDEEQLSDIESFINEGVERGEVYLGAEGKHGDEDYEPTMQLGLTLMHEGAYDRFMACSLKSSDWLFKEDPVVHYRNEFSSGKATTNRRRAMEAYRCFGWDTPEVLASVIQHAQHTDSLFDELAKHYVFNLMLGCARKHWTLQCGAGSGNADFSLQREMAKFTLEFTEQT